MSKLYVHVLEGFRFRKYFYHVSFVNKTIDFKCTIKKNSMMTIK